MPDLSITICGREFPISCGEGEEQTLLEAAALLDAESKALLKQDERLTEQKMLLMAGLVLADRTSGLQRDLRIEKEKATELEKVISSIGEVRALAPSIPETTVENLSEIASRAEVLATMVEEMASLS